MLRLIAGLTRSLPLLIALVVLAVAIYAFVSWRRTPTRAKEVMIKVFLVLCSAIAIFFALASLYAVADGNTPVLELSISCAAVGVVGLLIRWCAGTSSRSIILTTPTSPPRRRGRSPTSPTCSAPSRRFSTTSTLTAASKRHACPLSCPRSLPEPPRRSSILNPM